MASWIVQLHLAQLSMQLSGSTVSQRHVLQVGNNNYVCNKDHQNMQYSAFRYTKTCVMCLNIVISIVHNVYLDSVARNKNLSVIQHLSLNATFVVPVEKKYFIS